MFFSKIFKSAFLALAVAALSVSCAREQAPDFRDSGYSYIQFKVYK